MEEIPKFWKLLQSWLSGLKIHAQLLNHFEFSKTVRDLLNLDSHTQNPYGGFSTSVFCCTKIEAEVSCPNFSA